MTRKPLAFLLRISHSTRPPSYNRAFHASIPIRIAARPFPTRWPIARTLPNVRSSLDMLAAIRQDPQVIKDIHEVNFNYDQIDAAQEAIDRPDDGVYEMFRESPALQQAGIDPKAYYDEALVQSCIDPKAYYDEALIRPRIPVERRLVPYCQNAIVLLLTMLPNLESVGLPTYWRTTSASEQLIKAAVRRAHQDSSAPLAKVKIAEIPTLTYGIDLFTLPAITSLCVRESANHRKRETSTFTLPTDLQFGRHLRELSFRESCVDAQAIEEILRHTRNLQEFAFSYDSKEALREEREGASPPPPWDLRGVVRAVQQHAGHSLESFTLSFYNPGTTLAHGRADFLKCTQLRELRISMEFFVCNLRDLDTDPSISYGPSKHETQARAHKYDNESHDWPNRNCSLADLLPPSLEELEIRTYAEGQHHAHALKAMFKDFVSIQPSRFPNLKSLYIMLPEWIDETNEPFLDELDEVQNACEVLGIEFDVAKQLDVDD